MNTERLRIGKYVIVKKQPILFPAELAHADIVNRAESAGFFALRVTSGNVEVHCWGESVSLNLKSNEAADAGIISRFVGRISEGMQPFSNTDPMGVP